jgi:hypothetical protein
MGVDEVDDLPIVSNEDVGFDPLSPNHFPKLFAKDQGACAIDYPEWAKGLIGYHVEAEPKPTEHEQQPASLSIFERVVKQRQAVDIVRQHATRILHELPGFTTTYQVDVCQEMLLRYLSRLVLPLFHISLDDPVYIVVFHGTAPTRDYAMGTYVRHNHAERLKIPKPKALIVPVFLD